MKTHPKLLKLILCIALVVAFATACGPPKEITQVLTEEEFLEDGNVCLDVGLEGDFQPGKLVCTGVLEGEDVVIEIVTQVVDGNVILQIASFTANGVPYGAGKYAPLNEEWARDPILPDEGYEIISVSISDTEVTFISRLKETQ